MLIAAFQSNYPTLMLPNLALDLGSGSRRASLDSSTDSSRGSSEDSSTNSSLDSFEYSSTNCSMNSFADSSADSTLLRGKIVQIFS